MLRYSKLKGLPLKANDGEIGSIEGALIDFEEWELRYLLVQTGGWFNDRIVMIAPESIIQMNENEQNLAVNLDREQVKNAPELNPREPIAYDTEMAFREYYGLPMYWSQHGDPIQPHHAPDAVRQKVQHRETISRKGSGLSSPGTTDSRIFDLDAFMNFSVESSDENIGRIDDVIIEEANWKIDRFVVNLSSFMPNKLVLVQRDWADEVRETERVMRLKATTSAVKGSPNFRPFDSLFVREEEAKEPVSVGN